MVRDCAGFSGLAETYAAIRQQARASWPNMWPCVRASEVCRKRGGREMKARQPLRPTPYPRKVLHLVGVDGRQMPESAGALKRLIAAMGYATEFVLARPLESITQSSIASLHLCRHFWVSCARRLHSLRAWAGVRNRRREAAGGQIGDGAAIHAAIRTANTRSRRKTGRRYRGRPGKDGRREERGLAVETARRLLRNARQRQFGDEVPARFPWFGRADYRR